MGKLSTQTTAKLFQEFKMSLQENSINGKEVLMFCSSEDKEVNQLRRSITDETAREREKPFYIALQVSFPFLITGFGTVFTGLLLNCIRVSVMKHCS
mgnify:CR=1 FL=1